VARYERLSPKFSGWLPAAMADKLDVGNLQDAVCEPLIQALDK
jgi:hypothetical protein